MARSRCLAPRWEDPNQRDDVVDHQIRLLNADRQAASRHSDHGAIHVCFSVGTGAIGIYGVLTVLVTTGTFE